MLATARKGGVVEDVTKQRTFDATVTHRLLKETHRALLRTKRSPMDCGRTGSEPKSLSKSSASNVSTATKKSDPVLMAFPPDEPTPSVLEVGMRAHR